MRYVDSKLTVKYKICFMNQNSHLFDVKISDLMLNQVSDVKLGTMEAEK